jgi:hypothetical protein
MLVQATLGKDGKSKLRKTFFPLLCKGTLPNAFGKNLSSLKSQTGVEK